jgi:hypothetical protein
VPLVDVAAAAADIGRRPYEVTQQMEIINDATHAASNPS